MIVGALMALIFLGLPLAIIGLFIGSTLDRGGARLPHDFAFAREHSALTTIVGGARRRRIIYGQYPLGSTASEAIGQRVSARAMLDAQHPDAQV